MKTTHTPGPWQVNRKYKMSVETCADGQGINLIAECSDPDGFRTAGEDKANAILIAAAPDLLAALEKCCSYLADLNGCNWIDGDDCGSIDMRQRAKALQSIAFNSIAKAKGE